MLFLHIYSNFSKFQSFLIFPADKLYNYGVEDIFEEYFFWYAF